MEHMPTPVAVWSVNGRDIGFQAGFDAGLEVGGGAGEEVGDGAGEIDALGEVQLDELAEARAAVAQRRGAELASPAHTPFTLAFDVEKLTWAWDVTTKQDKTITEDNQAGIMSSRYAPGRYSDQERGVVTFQQWYLRHFGRPVTA